MSNLIEIPLSGGPGNLSARLDQNQYEKVMAFSHLWFAHKGGRGKTWYALAQKVIDGKKVTMRMHRLIMDAKPGQTVDHKDRNGVHNEMSNLRFANGQQQSANKDKHSNNCTSQYKGVCWDKDRKMWRAYIKINGKCKFLGYYSAEEDAALAYDAAALKQFGEFAFLNFPQENQPSAVIAA
jgi:hypothetical protein